MGQAEAILMIIGFLIEKGIPATIKIMDEWRKDDPQLQDFLKLKALMKRPEDYLTRRNE